MDKKTIARLAAMMLVGGLLGALAALIMFRGQEAIITRIMPAISRALYENSLYILAGVGRHC
jgi:hypothetical protein